MGERFRFRLETVLKLRNQRADACKRAVAERLRQIAGIQTEIAALQRQMTEELAGFREAHSVGSLNMTRITRHRYWLSHLRQGILTGQARMAELQGQLERDRKALAEARKQVRILEKLKERQLERHTTELHRLETRENDEIGNLVHLRKGMAASA